MQAKAELKHLRISPRKVGVVLDLIRNKPAVYAMAILNNTPKAAATPVAKLLKSAMAKLKNPATAANPAALQEVMEEFKFLKETQQALNNVLRGYGFGNIAMNV